MGVKTHLIVAVILVALAGAAVYFGTSGTKENLPGNGGNTDIACTMEAKLCPDGSYVGRSGPKCEFAECPAESPSPINTGNTLSIGMSSTINGTTIGILNLVEDSRCPVDVQCIQAGTVRVRAAIDAYSRDFTFKLGEAQTVGNAVITLASVIPAQKFSTQSVLPSDYRFTFTVSRINEGGTTNNSGIRGTVMLGPTCPVMQNPPDPQCADRPYETKISVSSGNKLVATARSNAQGFFEVPLPAGNYVLSAEGGKTLPSCSPVSATVSANNYVSVAINCDTGIR